jgi:hypothetical protein
MGAWGILEQLQKPSYLETSFGDILKAEQALIKDLDHKKNMRAKSMRLSRLQEELVASKDNGKGGGRGALQRAGGGWKA